MDFFSSSPPQKDQQKRVITNMAPNNEWVEIEAYKNM
jgi:hypothetical protein